MKTSWHTFCCLQSTDTTRLPFSRRQTTHEQDTDAFCCCDLDFDLDQVILIYELHLDILKMYPHTKNEVSTPSLSKVRARTDRSTDTRNPKHCHVAFEGGNDIPIFICLAQVAQKYTQTHKTHGPKKNLCASQPVRIS